MALPALTPAQRQVQAWMRTPPAEPIAVLRESLGDGFVFAKPSLSGTHAIVQVIVAADCDVLQHREDIRPRLDRMDWEWVTLKPDMAGRQQRLGFGIAPIRPRQANVAFHTTLKRLIPVIIDCGLMPSSLAIQQTDFPDTDARIHLAENLMGDGSAVRWISIFSERYRRPPTDYGILELDLRGVGGRLYEDIHTEFGLVIDRIDRIDPSRIREMNESTYTLEQSTGSAIPNLEGFLAIPRKQNS